MRRQFLYTNKPLENVEFIQTYYSDDFATGHSVRILKNYTKINISVFNLGESYLFKTHYYPVEKRVSIEQLETNQKRLDRQYILAYIQQYYQNYITKELIILE